MSDILFPLDIALDCADLAGGDLDEIDGQWWFSVGLPGDRAAASAALVGYMVESFADAYELSAERAFDLLRGSYSYRGGDVYFHGFEFI